MTLAFRSNARNLQVVPSSLGYGTAWRLEDECVTVLTPTTSLRETLIYPAFGGTHDNLEVRTGTEQLQRPRHKDASSRQAVRGRIFIGLVTSDRKLKASSEGSE